MTGRPAERMILALLFAASGLGAQALPFRVNGGTDGDRRHAAVANDGKGGFLVVWEETPAGAAAARIKACRFDAAGRTVEPGEIVVATADQPYRPAVAALPQGGFAVVWGDRLGVRARRFDAMGEPQIPILTVSGAPSAGFDVAAAADDGFVVVWEAPAASRLSTRPEPAPAGVHLVVERFGADGGSDCGPREISGALDGVASDDPPPPRIARAQDGSLLVSWQRGGIAGDVFVRELDGEGAPLARPDPDPERSPINLFHAGLQRRAAIAAVSRDAFAVVWESGPPEVGVDLALCLDGSESTAGGLGGAPADSLYLQLAGVAAALEDQRWIPTDGTLQLTVLEFGNPGVQTLVAGRRIDSTAAADLARTLRAQDLARHGGGSPAARCVCLAAEGLTGKSVCTTDDGGLGPQSLEPPLAQAATADGRRKVIVLATDAMPSKLERIDGDPPQLRSDAELLTRQLKEAAGRARQEGVETLNAVRVPIAGDLLRILQLNDISPESVPRVDLGVSLFPAEPENDRGFVSEVGDEQRFAEALGRSLEGVLAAESGVFARLFVEGRSDPPEIQINSTIDGDQAAPDVAIDGQGNWLFVWEDRPRGRISAQLFSAEGEPLGGEQEVSAQGVHAARPRLAPLGGGRFVAVWEQQESATGRRDLWARIVEPALAAFDARGAATNRRRSFSRR